MEAEDLMPEEMVKQVKLEKLKGRNTATIVKISLTVIMYGFVLYGGLSGLTLPDSLYTLCGVIFFWWLWYDILPFFDRKFGGKDMYQRKVEAQEFTFVQNLIKYLDKHPQIKDIKSELDVLSNRISNLEKTIKKQS